MNSRCRRPRSFAFGNRSQLAAPCVDDWAPTTTCRAVEQRAVLPSSALLPTTCRPQEYQKNKPLCFSVTRRRGVAHHCPIRMLIVLGISPRQRVNRAIEKHAGTGGSISVQNRFMRKLQNRYFSVSLCIYNL